MQSTSHLFKDNVTRALNDAHLQQALGHVRTKFIDKRQQAIDALPEFEALRDAARDLKNHVLSRLDEYLVEFEGNVVEERRPGALVRRRRRRRARPSSTSAARAGAKTVTKGKTMVGEEIGINDHLAANGIEPIETDLGEYIIQLRGEAPSHIIAPSVHVTKDQVEETFRKVHTDLDPKRNLSEPSSLLHEARVKLRGRFIAADVGITGANFLIADSGTTTIVTNEGNGDLTQTLPRIHIVLAGIEKIVPSIEDAGLLLRVLARSATGPGDVGLHDLLDRAAAAGGCRRAGRVPRRAGRQRPQQAARHRVRGDAALHPLRRLPQSLPDLSQCRRPRVRLGLCRPDRRHHHAGDDRHRACGAAAGGLVACAGAASRVCPVRIPIPKMLRAWREEAFERRLHGNRARWALKLWAALATRPALYRLATRHRRGRAGCARRQARPLRVAAVRAGVDRAPRPAGAAGAHLHGDVPGEEVMDSSLTPYATAPLPPLWGEGRDGGCRRTIAAEKR